MANTLIQIRKSNTSAGPGTTLFAGELAYSYNTVNQSLYIGANAGVGTAAIRIAGQKYVYLHQANTGTPGAQAANAVVITDGNSFVYNVFSQGLLLGGTVADPSSLVHVTSISNTGNSTVLGANNTGDGSGLELVTSAAITDYVKGYVAENGGTGSAAGANTTIQFNDSDVFAGDTDFTFDKDTNILALGNATTGTFRVRTGGANLVANGTTLVIQSNSTVNATITPTTLYVGNSTVNLTFGSSLLDVRASNANFSSNVTITGANVDATSAYLRVGQALISGNLVVTGNLTVSGTLTSIDTTNIVVQDPVILINDGGTTTDTADIGVIGYFGNSTVTQVGGLVRKNGGAAAGYSNTFVLFTSQTAFTNTTSTVPIDANLQLGILQSWLYASANSTTTGKLVANTSGVTITANSTWAVAFTANTLSLSTPLPVTSGGIGIATVPLGGLLLGNTTGALVALSPGSNGQILQVLNSAAAGADAVTGFSGIDCGTF